MCQDSHRHSGCTVLLMSKVFICTMQKQNRVHDQPLTTSTYILISFSVVRTCPFSTRPLFSIHRWPAFQVFSSHPGVQGLVSLFVLSTGNIMQHHCYECRTVPDVGSSAKMIAGWATTPHAMLNLLFSPPDKPRTTRPPGKSPPTCAPCLPSRQIRIIIAGHWQYCGTNIQQVNLQCVATAVHKMDSVPTFILMNARVM